MYRLRMSFLIAKLNLLLLYGEKTILKLFILERAELQVLLVFNIWLCVAPSIEYFIQQRCKQN